LTASVMDYMPMNAPSKGIENVDMWTPTIGHYDRLVIRYGYAPAVGGSEKSPETKKLLRGILEEYEEAGLQTCIDGDIGLGLDPTCVQDDLSSDPLGYYSDYLYQLGSELKQLMAQVSPGSPYTDYGDSVQLILSSVLNNAAVVANFIGGVHVSYAHHGYDGELRWHHGYAARTPVAIEEQLRALDILLTVMRPYSSGLLPKAELNPFLVGSDYDGIAIVDLAHDIRVIQAELMETFLTADRLIRIYAMEFERKRGILRKCSLATSCCRLCSKVCMVVTRQASWQSRPRSRNGICRCCSQQVWRHCRPMRRLQHRFVRSSAATF